MPLRDPASVGLPSFKENTAGLSLINSIGKGIAAAKIAKDKEDDDGITRALSALATPVKAKWAIDGVNYISPKVEATKQKYLNYIAENEKKGIKGLTYQQEIEIKAENNAHVEEATQSNAQYDSWAANMSKLSADKKGDYDDVLSRENLEIQADTPTWLEKNKDNPRYKEVSADWEEVKKDLISDGNSADGTQYMFRSLKSDKYGLVPLEKPFDFVKFSKNVKVSPDDVITSSPDGTYIWDTKKSQASYSKALIQGSIYYENLPQEDKTKAEKEFEVKTDKSIETPLGKETFDNASDYYAAAAATDAYNKVKTIVSTTAKAISGSSVAGKKASYLVVPNEQIREIVPDTGAVETLTSKNLSSVPDKYKPYVTISSGQSISGRDEKGSTINVPPGTYTITRYMERTLPDGSTKPYTVIESADHQYTITAIEGALSSLKYLSQNDIVDFSDTNLEGEVGLAKGKPTTKKAASTPSKNWNKYKRK